MKALPRSRAGRCETAWESPRLHNFALESHYPHSKPSLEEVCEIMDIKAKHGTSSMRSLSRWRSCPRSSCVVLCPLPLRCLLEVLPCLGLLKEAALLGPRMLLRPALQIASSTHCRAAAHRGSKQRSRSVRLAFASASQAVCIRPAILDHFC